ncbi:MAG: phosphodiester glycosidase family protein [Pyramidobacter sp.]|nr:phosphodiester glycosidase family protein [Pyramidobacter sp.]
MFRKKITAALALLLAVAAISSARADVPRGMVLGELMRVLDLPFKTGRTFTDVYEDTPYAQALESALSLGILYPAEDFEPEIPCTNAETLMFALQAMGFRHEADTARWAVPRRDKKELPRHVAGYVSVAKTMKPAAPASVTDDPWGTTNEAQLSAVLRWAEMCRRGAVWDYVIERPEGTLRLHRENVGRPPKGWRVQLGVFGTEEQAAEFARRKTTSDCPLSVEAVDTSYAVVTPLVSSSFDAWATAQKLNSHDFSAVVQPEAGDSEALFWASFIPADPGTAQVRMNRLDSASALGRLSDIAKRGKAIAAMNAGYFAGYGPIGTIFSGGLPVTLPYHNRSMAAWDKKGRMHFGGGEYRVRMSVNDGPLFPVLINATVDYGGTGIITPALGRSERRAGNNGVIARVKNGRITEAVPGLQFHRDMEPDEWLIVTRDPNLELKAGDRVRLEPQWREDPPFAVETAVQAGPLLYAPGHRFWDEMLSVSILTMRHPRTLIGSDGKRMVWIVADGRSSWHSRGLTLSEASALGRRLGLTSLLNLDGGGSTEMIFDGHVVNRLSDGRERKMPYGLIVPKK